MSSFVIGKQEYVKAAGVIGGIIKERNRYERRQVWLYDFEEGKNMEPEGYRKRFVQCYEMNAESVAKQYHEEEVECDPNDYDTEYLKSFQLGRKIAFDIPRLRKLAYELDFFARSVSYQIEDPEMNMVVDQWFSKIVVLLWRITDEIIDDRTSWGRFNLEDAVA